MGRWRQAASTLWTWIVIVALIVTAAYAVIHFRTREPGADYPDNPTRCYTAATPYGGPGYVCP